MSTDNLAKASASRAISPESVIEIRDPAIDVPAILDEVRAGLAARNYGDSDWDPQFPAFAPDGFPGPEWISRLGLDPELAYLLEQAGDDHDRLIVSMDARAPNVPVGAGALLRVKQAIHQLILFYVNQLGAKQVNVNTNFLRAIARMAAEQARLQGEVERLRSEVALLRPTGEADGR